jgi:uncharacterized membrane protein YdjX (TVP38/TMEM64 family)
MHKINDMNTFSTSRALIVGTWFGTVMVFWIAIVGGNEWFFDLCTGLGDGDATGLALFSVAAMFTCVAFVPVTVLAVAAGFLFGIIPGALTVSVAGTLGAALAFQMGRTLLRPLVETQISRRPRCLALVKAMDRHSFQVVFLTRLSPVIPSNFLNYVFGSTRASLPCFLAASWLGMLPATFFYASVGRTAKSLAEGWAGRSGEGAPHSVFVCFGAAATVMATLFVTRLARRSLRLSG